MTAGWGAWIVVPALDVARFHWTSRLPLALEIAGGVALAVATFFVFRAFADNTFASPVVRIQEERGQRVVSTGVYAVVRHPMYLGAALMLVGAPLHLGSRLGVLVGLALVLVLVVRIRDEEELLTRELDGYAAYRAKVRYRLVPHVW